MCVVLRCDALWGSFQYEKEALVEHMNDLESDVALFTTAKAISVHKAEDKCQRYKVGIFVERALNISRNHKSTTLFFSPSECFRSKCY